MSSTFYGLPCGRGGESFLLRTLDRDKVDRAILVDAAYGFDIDGSTTFDALQNEAPDLDRIDIAICTHEDEDHCHGFPNLLRAWTGAKKTIGELWLPGRWALAFPAASLRPKWSEQQIIAGAFAAASRLEDAVVSLLHEDGWDVSGDDLWLCDSGSPSYNLVLYGLQSARAPENGGPLVAPVLEGEQTNDWAGLDADQDRRDLASGIREVLGDRHRWETTEARIEAAVFEFKESQPVPQTEGGQALAMMFASSVLRTHDLILEVAATALEEGIAVRWFDYDEFTRRGAPAGGAPGFLEPVNSVQVLRTSAQPSAEVLALALKLSQSNVESLVFLRNGGHGEPPVLFTADSRLAEGVYSRTPDFPQPASISPDWPAPIITAPHHGSKSNEHAYGVAAGWFAPRAPIYVRNGGKHVRHGFAASFLSANPRTCVRCNGIKNPHRLIRIEAPDGAWRMPVHPVPCSCA